MIFQKPSKYKQIVKIKIQKFKAIRINIFKKTSKLSKLIIKKII